MKVNILPLQNSQWKTSKWQIKLSPGKKIMESLQTLAESYNDWGFCEFRMIGAVKANFYLGEIDKEIMKEVEKL